jgi:Mg/Co/Ni transporter MgtE
VLGIVCGHLARSQIRKDPNFTGGGIALAGLIVGYGFLVFVVVAMLAFVFLPILLQQMH